jgi:hypothetical protein
MDLALRSTPIPSAPMAARRLLWSPGPQPRSRTRTPGPTPITAVNQSTQRLTASVVRDARSTAPSRLYLTLLRRQIDGRGSWTVDQLARRTSNSGYSLPRDFPAEHAQLAAR